MQLSNKLFFFKHFSENLLLASLSLHQIFVSQTTVLPLCFQMKGEFVGIYANFLNRQTSKENRSQTVCSSCSPRRPCLVAVPPCPEELPEANRAVRLSV